MGKKRRYIQRVKKFGTKMFKFLDKVDGTADDKLEDSRIDNIIERIIVTDRGNQTIKLDARALGADFTGKNITYTVNSLTADDIAVNTSGTGKDKFRFPSAEPAVDGNGDVIELTPGSHTVTAVISGPGETAPLVTQTFNVARSAVTVGTLAAALAEGATNGQLKITLSLLTVSGKRPFEEADYDPKHDGAQDGFQITAVDSNGDAVAMAAAATKNDGAAATDEIDNLLNAALGATDTLTVTFTPLDSSNNPLTADAVSADIEITV